MSLQQKNKKIRKEKSRVYYDGFGDLLEVFIGKPTPCYYDDIGNEFLVGRDEKTEEIKGFMIIAFKKRLEKNDNAQYDEEKDVLYIRVGEPLECYYEELGEDVFVRLDEKTKEPRGFKVSNFKKRIIKLNFHELPEKVAVPH